MKRSPGWIRRYHLTALRRHLDQALPMVARLRDVDPALAAQVELGLAEAQAALREESPESDVTWGPPGMRHTWSVTTTREGRGE